MNESDFQELVTSVRQAGEILRGETAPSRQFVMDITRPDALATESKDPMPNNDLQPSLTQSTISPASRFSQA